MTFPTDAEVVENEDRRDCADAYLAVADDAAARQAHSIRIALRQLLESSQSSCCSAHH